MASKAEIRELDRDAVAEAVGGNDPEQQRQRWLAFWIYLGVPLALGFLLGWLQVGRAADWPRSVSLLYWVPATCLVMTPLQALSTALVAPLLRRFRSPLWLTLLLGQVVGGYLFLDPVLQAYRRWLQSNVYPALQLTSSATTLAEFLQRLPSNSLLWIGINLLFFHGLRMPRFGFLPASRPAPPPPSAAPSALPADAPPVDRPADPPRTARPNLMERVRPERRGALLALKADGHYLQVYTDAGSDLILYRLSDALLELSGDDGVQVHRSWWVAQRALAIERHRDRLVLVNGVEVPVSRSFRIVARQRGWLSPADPRD
jgi:hypothetical protein